MSFTSDHPDHPESARKRSTIEQEELARNASARAKERQRDSIPGQTNAPELLGHLERHLQAALFDGQQYLRVASRPPIYINDILANYQRLQSALATLAVGELWPCAVTQQTDGLPFSAPLDVPPSLAAMLIDQLRAVSTGELPFPSAQALPVQIAVSEKAGLGELTRVQPYLFGEGQKLVGLPSSDAEAGFVRGAKLDIDARAPFSPPEPPDPGQEPPHARVAVETAKPNLTVVYTNGYFISTLKQLGVSTPASANIPYGLYRFGLEVEAGLHFFQESLVSIPDQVRVWLSLEPQA
jgi:hypothetical protein